MGTPKCFCKRDADYAVNGEGRCIFHTPAGRMENLYRITILDEEKYEMIPVPEPERDESEFDSKFRVFVRDKYKEYNEATPDEKTKVELDCDGFHFLDLTGPMLTYYVPLDRLFDRGIAVPFRVNFKHITVWRSIILQGVYFLNEVDFRDAKINYKKREAGRENAWFTQAKDYSEITRIVDCVFYGLAQFNMTKFYSVVYFTGCKLLMPFSLMQAEFHDSMKFEWNTCLEAAYFGGAYFSGETEYHYNKFFRSADLTGVRVDGEMLFYANEIRDGASFANSGRIKRIELADNARYLIWKGINVARGPDSKILVLAANAKLDLSNLDIGPEARVKLSNTDMKSISLARTPAVADPVRIDFEGAKWYVGPDNRKRVYDEELINTGARTVSEVLEVYRRLRLNYESRLAYEEASDFHKGQMEMLYRSLKEDDPKKLFLGAYKLVSNFGEDIVRPLYLLIGFAALFFVYWYFKPLIGYTGGLLNTMNMDFEEFLSIFKQGTITDLLSSLGYPLDRMLYTLINFVPFTKPEGSGFDVFVGVLQRVIGTILITFNTLALRRAFRR